MFDWALNRPLMNPASLLAIKYTEDVATFTEEILNRKLHFLCSGCVLTGQYPEFFWAYRYICQDRDFNESIGKCTIR